MTDRTLSAAELDALVEDAERSAYVGLDKTDVFCHELITLVAQARRTEAAERKIQRVLKVIDDGPSTTIVFKADIRRALAED